MTAATEPVPPTGKPLRAKLGRDDFIMRGYMLMIAVYLIVALAMPLYAMLSKSFSTYAFDLASYEFQVSDEAGEFAVPPVREPLPEVASAGTPATGTSAARRARS